MATFLQKQWKYSSDLKGAHILVTTAPVTSMLQLSDPPLMMSGDFSTSYDLSDIHKPDLGYQTAF